MSGKLVHSIRDHPNHDRPLNGGMWGGTRAAVPDMKTAVRKWSNREAYMGDLDFLNQVGPVATEGRSRPARKASVAGVVGFDVLRARALSSAVCRLCGRDQPSRPRRCHMTPTRAPSIPMRSPSRRLARPTSSTWARSSSAMGDRAKTTSSPSCSIGRRRGPAVASRRGSTGEGQHARQTQLIEDSRHTRFHHRMTGERRRISHHAHAHRHGGTPSHAHANSKCHDTRVQWRVRGVGTRAGIGCVRGVNYRCRPLLGLIGDRHAELYSTTLPR